MGGAWPGRSFWLQKIRLKKIFSAFFRRGIF